jgi:uncharacterized membrane protein YfcA
MPAMLSLRALLYAVFAASGALFSTFVAVSASARARQSPSAPGASTPDASAPDPAAAWGWPTPVPIGIGFVTNFFDSLGIGSFATTTSIFKLLRLVPDGLIPGTLMVGHALPTLAQAFISIVVIAVDPQTLVLLIAASVLGSWLGAGVVTRLPRRRIQIGMGVALLAASALMLARMRGLFPAGHETLGLSGGLLVIGMISNFVLGALMNLGIGAYAPSLLIFGLLGVNERSIFPIMMGSCALIMPAGGIEFVRRARYAVRPALGLALGGVPGVLVALLIVKDLPLAALRWLVLGVVVYTGLTMLRSALAEKDAARAG